MMKTNATDDEIAELCGARTRQSGGLHDVDGRGEDDVPAVPAGAAHTRDTPHQLRGARRFHESPGADGAKGAAWLEPCLGAARLRRRTAPRCMYNLWFLQMPFCPGIKTTIGLKQREIMELRRPVL